MFIDHIRVQDLCIKVVFIEVGNRSRLDQEQDLDYIKIWVALKLTIGSTLGMVKNKIVTGK